MVDRAPRVFVSYSHDSENHARKVLAFANRLRADGFDAELDQYNDSPPEGWPRWCERQIEAADFVLMVCTDIYHQRFKGESHPNTGGLGVLWEAGIIRQLLYDAGALNGKFIPVILSDASPSAVPTVIRGSTWYAVSTEDGYKRLCSALSAQPGIARPPLGRLPARPCRWTEGPTSASPTTSGGTAASAPTLAAGPTVAASATRSVAIGGSGKRATIVTGSGNTVSGGSAERVDEER